MKRFLLIFFVLISCFAFAQTPQSIKYQAIVRNSQGNVLPNQLVSFKISIIKGNTGGQSVYIEIHKVATNDYGLANLDIGLGTVLSGVFSDINWGDDLYFVKTEVDNAGGSNYKFMGTTQLMSVPYALYAERSSAADNDHDQDSTNEIQNLVLTGTTLSLTKGNSVQIGGVVDLDYDPTNELQQLSINNNTLSLSLNGSSVNLPPDDDTDSTNELQTIAHVKQGTDITMTISDGNNTTIDISDFDNDSLNELQSLKLTQAGNLKTISISDSNTINFSVADNDNDSTNELQVLSKSNDTIFLSNGGFVKIPDPIPSGYCITSQDTSIPNGFVYSDFIFKKGELFESIQLPKWSSSFVIRYGIITLFNSEIYYFHGSYQGRIRVYKYSFQTEQWTRLKEIHDNYNPRVITNGSYIYLIGGSNSLHEKKIFRYDPTSDNIIHVTDMINERSNHGVCILNNKIYLIGGRGNNGKLEKCEYFDPDSNKTFAIADLPLSVEGNAAVSKEGKIYSIGGSFPQIWNKSFIFLYDPAIDKWTTYDSIPYNLTQCTAFNYKNGFLVFAVSGNILAGGSSVLYYEPGLKKMESINWEMGYTVDGGAFKIGNQIYFHDNSPDFLLKYEVNPPFFKYCKQ
jgi:Kelch motif